MSILTQVVNLSMAELITLMAIGGFAGSFIKDVVIFIAELISGLTGVLVQWWHNK